LLVLNCWTNKLTTQFLEKHKNSTKASEGQAIVRHLRHFILLLTRDSSTGYEGKDGQLTNLLLVRAVSAKN